MAKTDAEKPSGKPGDKPKSNMMLYGILGGAGALLLLCCICGGGGAGIYFFAFSGPTGDLSQEKYESLTIGLNPDEVDAHFAGKALRTDLKGAGDFARRNDYTEAATSLPAQCETFNCYGNRSKLVIVGFTKTTKYGALSTFKTIAEREGKSFKGSSVSGGDPVAARDKKFAK